MNKTTFKKFAVLAVSTIVLSACGGGSSDDPVGGVVSGTPLPSAVKGVSFIRCELLTSTSGSTLNGKAVTKYLQINADGTYSYEVWYSSATGCVGQAGVATGGGQTASTGEDVFRYNQSGVWTAGNMAADGSWPIAFAITGNTFTARTGTIGTQMRSAINTNCTMAMSGGSDFAVSSNTTCLQTNTNFIVPTPPVASLIYTQRLEVTARGIKLGDPSGLYTLGFSGSTLPTTSTTSYLTY